MAAAFGRAVDQNGIFSDHLDVAPVDDAVVLPSEQPEQARSTVNDDRDKARVGGVHLHIADIPQTGAVLHVDHILVSHIHNAAIHTSSPLLNALAFGR